ncbi:MAG: UDP-N-acetylmuramoyl-L-alanyl-D-glutamate--2,6-diaminopimelate ligase [Caldicoprobacter oshimai]|uniref:UDP-N-acetylmuramoyl-L-alanyl-D-glutamate--2,6-diaminopimelate ligase n=1 Tax=Caldicoprobacter faecalis TaxID=937334 RepID=A0A1I5XLQ4_9FIRM|nr:UDP-N-acetylmuramoyl-L-alanyl-D-glutamate--2,6-diaminopimelate ligase [Caldicoprobacter faecalis]PZN11573.1 MAG: UDP-N-acetylmuramoyl-L-alanyl-D-glutamate--2,6-diaminopimelate ligase [Caldicoprobacter oshimai]SFQ32874.1 UDP-N-acetylmuramoylalanyl-D-glutamate--2,6-diaminopimelate ligase [Caldicoprobacter faecalis]
MLLKELLNGIQVSRIEGSIDKRIDAIYYDSRKVTPGALFFCIEGFRFDGHDFAGEAVAKGAQAVVLRKDVPLPQYVTKVFVEDTRLAMALISRAFYGYPARNIPIIGVTGTNGKTTVTYLIKSILEDAGKKVGLIGTIANMIGPKMLPAERTTPESVDLQKLFKDMQDEGVDAIVMEVSSHSLSLKRVAGVEFEVGVFTNLTQDHLDFHNTLEEYREAKAKLFLQSRQAAINIDDETGRMFAEKVQGPLWTYGISRTAQVFARDIEITSKGVLFQLFLPDGSSMISLNIPGLFSVYNALAAATACHALGVPLHNIRAGLEKVKGIPGRFELLNTGTEYSVIIDYAHTPDGLENVLKTARDFTKGRVITVFGCGGDRDPSKRPIMGEVAGRYSDFCIITSDNPRNEDPMAIIQQIIPGVKKTACPYVVIEDRREAIAYALNHGRAGDVIILAGKGHETYQILKNNQVIPFDEREVVAELLGKEKV